MMKLHRLYTNKPDVFQPILFRSDLSVIIAEIRLPENRLLDTHNLGKTTIGELLDFCLLKKKSGNFFLFKHKEIFQEFIFYLEIQLSHERWLTIARPVDPGSRINYFLSSQSVEDAGDLPLASWDHSNVPFERARLLLDAYLKIEALRPWGFRKLVGYLIRSQADYLDVFQLGKFSGKHLDWKPFVAHLIGLDAHPVISLYETRELLTDASAHLTSLTQEWGTSATDPSVLDGLIAVKRRDVESKSSTLESFNFASEDRRTTHAVVEETEAMISDANEEFYRLNQMHARLLESLEEENILFKPADAEKLFRQAGVLLGDQVKRDYNQLIEFNRAITRERRDALQAQLVDARDRLERLASRLQHLNDERARSLEYLRESEVLTKYKETGRELAVLQADLNTLEARRESASRLIELRRNQRGLNEDLGHWESAVEAEIDAVSRDSASRFGLLRRYFQEIIREVVGQDAILAIRRNSAGGIDFIAEFIGAGGIATSGDRGTSYKKLLCIAFDLALLRVYVDAPFPRFVYHDGALEQLEPRKRENLLRVLREYSSFGVQSIISVLDSDLPAPPSDNTTSVQSREVVLTLHDEGMDGRLFKMDTW